MSWLFGGNNDKHMPPLLPVLPGIPGGAGVPGGAAPPGDKGKGGKDSKMEAYQFDSTALERAAKAAKELESSSEST